MNQAIIFNLQFGYFYPKIRVCYTLCDMGKLIGTT